MSTWTITLAALAVATLLPLGSSAALAADAATLAFTQQVKSALAPIDQGWAVNEGVAALTAPGPVTTAAVVGRVAAKFAPRRFDSSTLEAVAAVVLVEAEARARQDLREIAEAIEANNRLKEALRDLLDEVAGGDRCTSGLEQELQAELQERAQEQAEATAAAASLARKHHAMIKRIVGSIGH